MRNPSAGPLAGPSALVVATMLASAACGQVSGRGHRTPGPDAGADEWPPGGADGGGAPESPPPAGPGSGGKGGPVGTFHGQKLDVTGVTRTYSLHVPGSYDPAEPIPLLIFLHPSAPATFRVEDWLPGSGLVEAADRGAYILAAPRGCNYMGGASWCQRNDINSPADGSVDDESLFLELRKKLFARYNVNTRKSYTAGFSAGGFQAVTYGFSYSDKLAGMGVFAAGWGMGNEQRAKLFKSKVATFIRVYTGDPNVEPARQLVKQLRFMGWPDERVDSRIGEAPGGHTMKKEDLDPMWAFFDRFAVEGD